MDWMQIGIVLLCIPGNLLAQQGYNYPAPEKPFSGTPSKVPGQQESTGSQAGTQVPPNNYQRPGQGFPSTNRPIPGAQQNGYPSRPNGPQSPMQNGYPNAGGPSRPPGLYGTPSVSQARPGSPQGGPQGYPGPGAPGQTDGFQASSSRPELPQGGYPRLGGPQGFPGPGTTGKPASPGPSRPGSYQNGYPGPSARPEQPQGGYPGSAPSFPGQSVAPGSGGAQGPSTRPGPTQGGYPRPVQGPQGYPGPSSQPGQPGGYPETSNRPGYPGPSGSPGSGASQGLPGVGSGPSGFPNAGQPAGLPQQGSDGQYEDGDYSAIPGEPDKDYPIFSYIPETSFSCDQQQYPGYYADIETRCQVFHICANNKTYDFLCPNGTVFHQEYLVCVWWNQFDCSSAPSLYGINANIYDHSISGASQAKQGQGGGPQGANGYPQGYPGPGGSVTEQGPSSGQKPAPTGYTDGYQGAQPGYPTTPGYSGNAGQTQPGPGGFTQQPSGPRRPAGPSQPTSGYPSGRPQSASPGFPARPGYQNERPGYTTTNQPSSEGYPSGKPATPFPGSSFGPQQPTREYLPPF